MIYFCPYIPTGNIDAIETLLNYGADPNIRCKHSKLIAIECAMYQKRNDIVKLLWEHSINYDIKMKHKINVQKRINIKNLISNPKDTQELYYNIILNEEYAETTGNGNSDDTETKGNDNEHEIITEHDVKTEIIKKKLLKLNKQIYHEYSKLIDYFCFHSLNFV